MRKSILTKLLTLSPIAILTMLTSSGCSSTNDKETRVIRILNTADYIYEEVNEEDCEEEDFLSDKPMLEQFVEAMNDKHADEGIKYSYVYETYDTNENLYNELMTGKANYDVINTSDYMIQKLISNNLIQTLSFNKEKYEDNEYTTRIRENISNFLWNKFDSIHPKDKDTNAYLLDKNLSQYSVPYMWGTVGVMYNPANKAYSSQGLSIDDVIDLFSSWDALYSKEAKNTVSIKDSVRDTYAVSVVHAFYEDKIVPLEEKLAAEEISSDEFNKELNKIFNLCDNESLKIIQDDMIKLKNNSFGFEVDSGKTDMVEGKIGGNLAWSGDATWAIEEAETDYGLELYFSIPEEGSNIWFDGWAVPTNGNLELALEFIDFMADPAQAVQNSYSVGYTSSSNGYELLNYAYECFDVREEVGGEVPEGYVEGEDYILYNLSYFFGDAVENPEDAIIYAYPEVIGRTLTSAYPEEEVLPHLCIMDDFGTQNSHVLDMWENVRTNALPLWAVIIFIIEGVALLLVIAYFVRKKIVKNQLRKKRHNRA